MTKSKTGLLTGGSSLSGNRYITSHSNTKDNISITTSGQASIASYLIE